MTDVAVTGGPLAAVTAQSILDQYEQGAHIPDIALSLGVSHQAIYRHLIAKSPDQWRDHQAARALAALELADEDLKTAADALALARAREQLKSAQWKLERLLRRLYGNDVPEGIQSRISISIGIDRHGPVTVDGQVVDSLGE